MKTVFFAVFKVTCGRVLCVHRDGSVHTLFDCSNAVKAVETVNADVSIAECTFGSTCRSPEVTIVGPEAS